MQLISHSIFTSKALIHAFYTSKILMHAIYYLLPLKHWCMRFITYEALMHAFFCLYSTDVSIFYLRSTGASLFFFTSKALMHAIYYLWSTDACIFYLQSTDASWFLWWIVPFLQSALQEARHAEVTANRHNEFVNSKLRDVSALHAAFTFSQL